LSKTTARIKRLVKPGLGFFSMETARRRLQGYEAMHMIRKGQMHGVNKGASLGKLPSWLGCLEWWPELNKR